MMTKSLLLSSILFVIAPALVAAADDVCRSNSTHIAWRCCCCSDDDDDDGEEETPALSRRHRRGRREKSPDYLPILLMSSKCSNEETTPLSPCACHIQTLEDAQAGAFDYLAFHMFAMDINQAESLGFNFEEGDAPDGLDGGIIGPTVELALQAKIDYVYTDALPPHLFGEFVLNYANVNEARNNWRPLMHDKLKHLVTAELAASQTAIPDVVKVLNEHMWTILSHNESAPIRFVSSQTPLIYDPMSILAFGYASCTGLAILFINGLRAVGVPARLSGTPAWHQRRASGNHNWVEVWNDGQWYFLEPSPSAGGHDTLDRDPCERWFCSATRFNGLANTTQVSAARLDASASTSFYRLAWDWMDMRIPGVDMTAYYREQCGKCK